MEKITYLIKKYTDTKFEVIAQTNGKNHFISQVVTISPSNDKTIEIEISVDDRGYISIVDSNLIQLKTFNIAEGYSQDEMAMGIASLLEKNYKVGRKKLFGNQTVTINLGKNKVYGNLRRH